MVFMHSIQDWSEFYARIADDAVYCDYDEKYKGKATVYYKIRKQLESYRREGGSFVINSGRAVYSTGSSLGFVFKLDMNRDGFIQYVTLACDSFCLPD